MAKVALITGIQNELSYLVAEKLIKYLNMRVIAPVRVRGCVRAQTLSEKYGNNVVLSDFSPLNGNEAKELVSDVDYVLNLDFVGMPESEHFPDSAEQINYFYTKNLVDAVKERGGEVKFLELSTTGVYGGRTTKRPYVTVGHPAMPAYFDNASVSKLRGERYLVESGIDDFTVLRSAPVLDDSFIKKMTDGAMIFKNPLDAPVEYITAEELSEIIYKIVADNVENGRKIKKRTIFDVGSGERFVYLDLLKKVCEKLRLNRDGIAEPKWFVSRCGYGAWLKDGRILQDILNVPKVSVEAVLDEVLSKSGNRIFGTLSPLIKRFIVSKLSIMTNSPYYWQQNGMTARTNAFYGGYDKIRSLPSRFSDVSISAEEEENLPGFYDENTKPFLCEADLKSFATARGGKCFDVGSRGVDFGRKTLWECADGHTFKMTPFGVLYGGYWCDECMTPAPWKYSYGVKKSPYHGYFYRDEFSEDEELYVSADDYHDVMREDISGKVSKPDKIKKFRKG